MIQLIKGKNATSLNKSKIKAILIDSGKVLNEPVTGHWFITPNFFKHVDEKRFRSIPASERQGAFDKAAEYICKQNFIHTEAEEYHHFLEYYRIFSRSLPKLQLKDEDVQAIAGDLVYNYDKYGFYKDAVKLMPEFSKEYKLAVVSDAWPSLENVFKKAEMRQYFSSFVISSIKGVTKPDPLMYQTALQELGVSPQEAIFIDDSMKNCDGAMKLGIKSFLLCRDCKSYFYNKLKHGNYNVIRSFEDVKKLYL